MERTWHLRSTAADNALDLRFADGVHTLGSAPDSDLRVSDPTVSRNHARLTCTEDGVTIEDLGFDAERISFIGCRHRSQWHQQQP